MQGKRGLSHDPWISNTLLRIFSPGTQLYMENFTAFNAPALAVRHINHLQIGKKTHSNDSAVSA
jgi:hypothetical protein